MTIKHTPGKWSSQWAEKNMNYIPGPIAQLYPTKVNEELLVLAWASWQTRLESLEEDYVEAEANAHLMALAPTAPHECDDPECPGNKNRLKLEMFEQLVEMLREIAKGAGPFSLDHLTHCENTVEAMKDLALAAIAKAEGRDT